MLEDQQLAVELVELVAVGVVVALARELEEKQTFRIPAAAAVAVQDLHPVMVVLVEFTQAKPPTPPAMLELQTLVVMLPKEAQHQVQPDMVVI